jgi:hypothetical protein
MCSLHSGLIGRGFGLVWKHIVHESAHQEVACLTIQHLGEKISKVIRGTNVANKGFTHDNSLTYCMVFDSLWYSALTTPLQSDV